MTASPAVSVVVPVKNGAARLPDLLAALTVQTGVGPLERIAIDSGSSDGSIGILEAAGSRVIRIRPDQFDHGSSRNLGLEAASARFVCFSSQDAQPVGPSCLARLAEALSADDRLAGVFARQLPRADADPLTRRDIEGWVAGSRVPRTTKIDDWEEFQRLEPIDRYRAAAFDNVCSMVRRDVALAHPFSATRFGEDVEWSARMLRLGYAIGFVPEAEVIHSHPRRARALYRRNYLGHRLLLRLFELRTVPDRSHLALASLGAVSSDLATLARSGAGPELWLKAPFESLAATYGQYRGARDEARGRPYPAWA